MQETWLYQEGVEDALKEVWSERFGEMPAEVAQRIQAVHEAGPLKALLRALIRAADVREAMARVLALQPST